MAKYFSIPFGLSGDRLTVPDATQADGSVSYSQGFGPDYERKTDGTDPLAKPVPRDSTNSLYFDITEAIGEIQKNGVALWQSAAAPYPINSLVRHSNVVYRSTVANNSTTPGTGTSWVDATQISSASEAAAGIIEIATQAETSSGISDDRAVTPRKLSTAIQLNSYSTVSTSGTGGDSSVSPIPAWTAYVAGQKLDVLFGTNSSPTHTLNVSGLGAKTIKQYDPVGTKVAAVFFAGMRGTVVYDGTDFVLLNRLDQVSSSTAAGIVQLSTQTQVNTGTSSSTATTPAALANNAQSQAWLAVSTGGTPPASTVSPSPAWTSYSVGKTLLVTFGAASVAGHTLNVSGLGALNIRQYNYLGSKVPAIFFVGTRSYVVYDGTDLVMLNPVHPYAQATEAALGVSRMATLTEVNAGTNDTAFITPLKLASSSIASRIAALEARELPLGQGQTNQDMLASRANNVTYTNTTGRSILVSVYSGSNNAALVVGEHSMFKLVDSGQTDVSCVAIVPAGQTYRYVSTVAPTVWEELRA